MSDGESRLPATSDNVESADKQVQQPNRDRSRSTSPVNERSEKKLKPKRKDAGFKWKEKRRDDDEAERDQGLKRGYRDHYKPRERERSRSRSPRRRDYDDYESRRGSDRNRDRDRERDRNYDSGRRHGDRDDRRGDRYKPDDRDRERTRDGDRQEKKDKPEKKKAAPIPSMPQQEMILVTVNDRLGTKKQIPCLPSDTVKDFKSVVAMMIGRRPHEILLKRQSERPFKDFLTLQDYGISNNVQLDLEVDTGD